MASMSPTLYISKDMNLQELAILILEDERWNVAKADYGMKEVRFRVNPLEPTTGRLYTHWKDAAGALGFVQSFVDAFRFTSGNELVAEPKGTPEIEVSPLQMGSASAMRAKLR